MTIGELAVKTRVSAACVAVCAVASTSGADIVEFGGSVGESTEQTGAVFSGALDYEHLAGDSGRLIVTLANESPDELGGFLTGFVFNIGSSDGGATARLSSGTHPGFLDTGPEMASPFGWFDAGAALGANWTGGGSPRGGVGAGDSGEFVFDVTATDAGSLTAHSFLSGPAEFNFVARFRGLADGGSDKVPVPAPASLAMVFLGVAAIGRRSR